MSDLKAKAADLALEILDCLREWIAPGDMPTKPVVLPRHSLQATLARIGKLPKAWRGTELEAAAQLGVHRCTLRRYRIEGRVQPDVVRGHRRLYSKECLERFVELWFANPDREGEVAS